MYDHNFTISGDDLMTKLWQICDDFMIILWFFRKSGPWFHLLQPLSGAVLHCFDTVGWDTYL